MSRSPDLYLSGLIFFATLCSYNLYWLLSGYLLNGNRLLQRSNVSNIIFLLIGIAGVCLMLIIIPTVIFYLFIGGVITALYFLPLFPGMPFKFLRKAGFIKTVLLAFAWSYVTVIIPLAEMDGVGAYQWIDLFLLRFLLLLMLCIIFDSRDAAIDKIRSLHSLATDVSPQTLRKIFLMVLFCFFVLSGIVCWHIGNQQQLVHFFLTGIAAYWIYDLSQRPRGYFFYYFMVDGMMIFSAFTSYLATFDYFASII